MRRLTEDQWLRYAAQAEADGRHEAAEECRKRAAKLSERTAARIENHCMGRVRTAPKTTCPVHGPTPIDLASGRCSRCVADETYNGG